jgi:hypothetical protein
MKDHALSLSVAYAIAPETALRVYAHDLELVDDGAGGFEHQKPSEIERRAVLIKSESEPLVGSASYARGLVEITVESDSDEDNSETHAQRVTAVADTMADLAKLQAGAAKVGELELLGKACPTQTNPETVQRAFSTVLSYRIGYKRTV